MDTGLFVLPNEYAGVAMVKGAHTIIAAIEDALSITPCSRDKVGNCAQYETMSHTDCINYDYDIGWLHLAMQYGSAWIIIKQGIK